MRRIPSIFNKASTPIFIRLACNGFAQAFATIGTVLIIRMGFDKLIVNDGVADNIMILKIGAGLFLFAIMLGWLLTRERIDAEKIGQNYIHRIRMMLFRHMSRLGLRTLQQRSRGGVLLRFIGDLNALKRWISLGLVRLLVAGISTFCSLTALAFINWRLALAAGIVLGLGAVYCLSLGKPIRDTTRESRRRRVYLATNISEKISNMAVVQVFGQTRRETRRVSRQSGRLVTAQIKRAEKIGQIRGATLTITALAGAVVLLTGAREIGLGQTTPGTVVAAMTIVGMLTPALRDLSRIYEYWQDSRISVEKIEDFINIPRQRAARSSLPELKPGPGYIEIKGVKLDGLLHDINATAKPGSNIIVKGGNGTGKSTLLFMIAGLIEPDEGEIFIDGQDIFKHNQDSVRRTISMVSPDLPLLRGTLKKNLIYRCPDVSEEEMERIWKLCGIDEIIKTFPQGLDTRITEEGDNLSFGQRQKISLARAISGNPQVILLDEADVHLDAEASSIFTKIISDFKGTILWVTHNKELSSFRDDKVWLIEKGTLVQGTEARKKQA